MVHAVTPAAGLSLRSIVWSLAEQLNVVARGPAELVTALERDRRRTVIVLPDLHEGDGAGLVLALVGLPHVRLIVESRSGGCVHQRLSGGGCAELDLDLGQWRDEERFAQWSAARAADRAASSQGEPPSGHGVVDLSDPAAVCAADPWQVTDAYGEDGCGDHGGLRAAWLRAGQSLCRDQSPTSRALVLLSLLGDGADPRVRPALVELAAGAGWRMEWSRVRGDMAPSWPGPVTTLAVGRGPVSGCLLLAGADGVVKTVHAADASAHGRLRRREGGVADVVALSDGTVLALDGAGSIRADTTWAVRSAGSGLARLLDHGPTESERLIEAVRSRTGTALAAAPGSGLGVVVLGNAAGAVETFGDVADTADLHDGPVTSVAAISVPTGGESSVPLVYSGAADGTVRTWSPGHSPMPVPLVERPCPVVSLGAAVTQEGPSVVVAWGDGVVQYFQMDLSEQRAFVPGPPVRAVALDSAGRAFIGMDEAVICLVSTSSFGTGGESMS
ncbi:hypothetical protein [Streptomyces hydrogenans]|uniref:hypothetical protein n=1 Tax=Streptomyces hydrogenans TaxID=1873719 RepID=UPI0034252CA5